MQTKTHFKIGELQVFPDKNTISSQQQEITLQPKVMAVLCYLATHQQRVVSIDELLIEQVWQGAIVGNHAVQRCISSIRKTLEELTGESDNVKSYYKKGYQLTVSEKPNGENNSHPAIATNTGAAQKIKSTRFYYLLISLSLGILIILPVSYTQIVYLHLTI